HRRPRQRRDPHAERVRSCRWVLPRSGWTCRADLAFPTLGHEDDLDRVALALANDPKTLLDLVERKAMRHQVAAANAALAGQRERSLDGVCPLAPGRIQGHVVTDCLTQVERDRARIER